METVTFSISHRKKNIIQQLVKNAVKYETNSEKKEGINKQK